jgi:hypothetical protein
MIDDHYEPQFQWDARDCECGTRPLAAEPDAEVLP